LAQSAMTIRRLTAVPLHRVVVSFLSPGDGPRLRSRRRETALMIGLGGANQRGLIPRLRDHPIAGRVPCLHHKARRPVCRVGHGTGRRGRQAPRGASSIPTDNLQMHCSSPHIRANPHLSHPIGAQGGQPSQDDCYAG